MGYYIYQREQSFRIKKKKIRPALEAIKDLVHETSYRGPPVFAWVTNSHVRNADSLEAAMLAWRWHAVANKHGDITELYFEGQKHGDDELLFEAIAPYVEGGSYIEMSGEEGERWRWVFEDKALVVHEGTIDFQPKPPNLETIDLRGATEPTSGTKAANRPPMVTLTREEATLITDLVEDYRDRCWDVLEENPKRKALAEGLKLKARNINTWYRNQ